MEASKTETANGHSFVSMIATIFLLRWTLMNFGPNSPARPYLAALLIACCFTTMVTANKATDYAFLNSYISFAFGGQLALDIIDHVLYSKRYFPDDQAKLGKSDRRSKSETFWLIDILFNRRKIATPAQIRNIPQFDQKDRSYVPTRGWFLTSTAIRLVLSMVIIELTQHPTHADAVVRYGANRREIVHLIFQGKFSIQDFGNRVFDIMRFWVNTYFTQGLFFDFWSMVMVGFGFNEVEEWPPRFGPLLETYTLRRYWGIFWHQDLRTALAAGANYTLDRTVRLPKKSAMTNWVKAGMTFFISGALHYAADLVVGIPNADSGSIAFFTLQVFGFWLEDTFQSLYGLIENAIGAQKPKPAEKDGKPNDKEVKKASAPAPWRKVAGYIWLVLWLTWVTPFFTFPHWRHGAESLLPAHAESYQKADYIS